MRYAKEAKRLLRHRGVSLEIFAMLCKTLASSALLPGCAWLFRQALNLAGVRFVTQANLAGLLHPLALLAYAVIALLLALYTLVELSAVVLCFEYARRGQAVGLRRLLLESLRRSAAALRPRNFAIVALALATAPLGDLFLITDLLHRIRLPESLGPTLMSIPILRLASLAFLALTAVMSVNWPFAFHVFFLEGRSMRDSLRESRRLMRGRRWQMTLGLLAYLLPVFLIALLVVLAGAALLVLFAGNRTLYVLLAGAFAYLEPVFRLLLSVVCTLSVYAYLSARYYALRAGEGALEALNRRPLPGQKRRLRPAALTGIACGVLAVCAAVNAVSAYRLSRSEEFALGAENPVQIVAHRGSSLSAPENTLPAYLRAIEDGADYGELDVQWTKDKVLVLAHDANLAREGGIRKNIWEVTYAELMRLDRGARFGAEFAGTRFATLEEVIRACRGRLKLMIEIKADSHNLGIERAVVDMVRKYNFEDQCIIASLSLACVERVEAYAPDIRTQYLITLGVGALEALPAVDAIGVEVAFVTRRMVERLHAQGKEVFAWTVNDDDNIELCVECGVDYIITDDPLRTRVVAEGAQSSLFRSLLEIRDLLFAYIEEIDKTPSADGVLSAGGGST